MAEKNKVKFGLKNVHIAKMTTTTDPTTGKEAYSYAAPKAWPGAVSLSMDMQGGLSPFYADDRKYYVTYSHTGYEGDLESALVPDFIKEEIFGDTIDENGILSENTQDQPNEFALLFEFDGDAKATRHILYNCTMTRPSLGSQTKEETAEPQTESATISASPRGDGLLHTQTTSETPVANYNAWYDSVYVPAADDGGDETEAAKLSSLSIGSLTLTPAFDADTISYTATTENATNTITATAAEGITVAIKNGDTDVESGAAATWEDGENTVTITASADGMATTTYTVVVTKSE